MSKEMIYSANAPAAIGPYSQAILAGNTMYCSGMLAIDPATGNLVGETAVEQVHQIFKNLKALLAEAGCTLENVVKTTVFMKDLGLFADVNAAYAEYFTAPFPARSAVEVSRLPKDAQIEVEVICVK